VVARKAATGHRRPSLSSLLPLLQVFLRGERGGGVLVSGGWIRPGPCRIRGLGRRIAPWDLAVLEASGGCAPASATTAVCVRGAAGLRRCHPPATVMGAPPPFCLGRDGAPSSGGGAPRRRRFDDRSRCGGASLVPAVCLPRRPLHGLGGGWWLPWPARSWEVGLLGMEMCWWRHGSAAGGGPLGCVRAALWWCCWRRPWIGAPETPWRHSWLPEPISVVGENPSPLETTSLA
jgi:hypothetical protein